MQGYCEPFPKKGYTFDPESKTCKKFFESGCGMTKNAFLKKEECEAKCGNLHHIVIETLLKGDSI